MKKETLITAAKFTGGVLAVLFAAKLVKTHVLPKAPAGVAKAVGSVLP